MRRFATGRFWLTVAVLGLAQVLAAPAEEIVSEMKNVNAVMEIRGYRLNPAFDMAGKEYPGDHAPTQAFEIIRPSGEAVTIGRLYTSCTCVQLAAPKRSFDAGERAVLELRNVRPTPLNGQIYAVYVQITRPIRTTLRYDTFVQSNNSMIVSPPVVVSNIPTAPAAPLPMLGETPVLPVVPGEPAAPPAEPIELAEPADKPADAAEPADKVEAADKTEPAESAEPASEPETGETEAKDAADDKAAVTEEKVEEKAEETADAPPATTEEPVPASPAANDDAKPAADVNPAADVKPAAGNPAPVKPAAAAGIASSERKHISMVTIGVADLAKSVAFYEALGWVPAPRSKYDTAVFIQLDGQVMVLYPMPELLRDQNMLGTAPRGGGVTLAIHVEDKAEVAEMYAKFIKAGGMSLKEPTEMPSGAVTSYVADPDGNVWEVSWVPQFRLDAEGGLWLP